MARVAEKTLAGLPGGSALHDGPTLRHRQLARLLRNEIGAGTLRPGDRLPPLTALSDQYGFAISTIRQALSVLAEEGLVEPRHGSGTYVSDTAVVRPPITLDLGWPELGYEVSQYTATLLHADDQPPVLTAADCIPAAAYRHLRRTHRTSDGFTYSLADIWVDRQFHDLAPARFETEMALLLLEEFAGPQMTELSQSLRIGAADPDAAEALGIPLGSPIGHLRRVLRTRSGTVAYCSMGQVRADAVLFEATIVRDVPLVTGRNKLVSE
jgi:GntR family transcriptional regulator